MRGIVELFDRRTRARSLAFMFAAGALLVLLTLVLPHSAQVDELPLLVLGAAAVGFAALIWARSDSVEDWQVHAALAIGTVIVTLANYWVGGTALYALMYSWIALYAFYFFSLDVALVHLLIIGVAYALLVGLADHPSPVTRWLLAVGTPLVAGVLISRLLDRLQGEAGHAAEQTRGLLEGEARTRLILESAPDPFVAVDADGVVLRWNEAAARLFGWPPGEAIGRELGGLIFPEEGRAAHDERRRELLEASETMTARQVETTLRRRDGSTFPAEKTIARVQIGDHVMVTAFIRDLTDRRRRDEERAALLRAEAARVEAERLARLVGGLQGMVDAVLMNRALEEILPDLAERVQQVLQADAASIFLADSGQLLLRASSPRQDGLAQVHAAFGEGLVGRVADTRRPVLIEDPHEEDVPDPGLRAMGLRSLLGVPLMAEERVAGVIVVGRVDEQPFSWEESQLLQLAADRVGLAVDQSRVHELEHRMAETLQRSLLPERLPELPGLLVSAEYKPAAIEEAVGGDWYDVIPVPGGRIGVVMGDVAGKGLSAASMVGRLRSALRAYAIEGHEPAVVVDRLNRLMWTDLAGNEMATLLYVVLDPAEGELEWVNAGHLPPLLMVGERLPHFLEGDRSVPLGVMPFPPFEQNWIEVEPGTTLVLYTDGLVERPGEIIDRGLTRLVDAVRRGPEEPGALCKHLLDELVPSRGTSDDVAVLVLQNTPITDRFSMSFPAEPGALTSMRSVLRRWLRHAQGTDQEIAEITTACGEAATNAIEHSGASGDAPFEVDARVDGRDVEIAVRDFGVWRPRRQGDMQGRGLSLIEALMDEVQVIPGPEGTVVQMRRRLDGSSES